MKWCCLYWMVIYEEPNSCARTPTVSDPEDGEDRPVNAPLGGSIVGMEGTHQVGMPLAMI